MSRYTDEIMGHADESDGIEEYDNPLPDWWLGLFFVSIVFAVIYGVNYHFVADHSQAKFYDAEVLAAAEKWPQLNQTAAMDTSPETLALGEEVFNANCSSCHNTALTGGIGPNLIDTEWIHGGEFENLVAVINEGVAAKGMPQWGPILGPKKVAAAASYILSKNTGEAPAAAPTPDPSGAGGPPEAADTGGEPVEALAVALEVTPEAIAEGEKVFTTKCVACHQADLTGGVGPNLVDEEWIHGGELEDIARTVTQGVPDKGMITWKGVLSDAQIAQVSAYVYSKSHDDAVQ